MCVAAFLCQCCEFIFCFHILNKRFIVFCKTCLFPNSKQVNRDAHNCYDATSVGGCCSDDRPFWTIQRYIHREYKLTGEHTLSLLAHTPASTVWRWAFTVYDDCWLLFTIFKALSDL